MVFNMHSCFHPSRCFLVRVSKKTFVRLFPPPLTILFPFLFSRIEEKQQAPEEVREASEIVERHESPSTVHPVPVLRTDVQDEQELDHPHEVRLRRAGGELRVPHLLGHVREEHQTAQAHVAKAPHLHTAKVFRPQKDILETSYRRENKFSRLFSFFFDEDICSSSIDFLRFFLFFETFDNVPSNDLLIPYSIFKNVDVTVSSLERGFFSLSLFFFFFYILFIMIRWEWRNKENESRDQIN